MMESSPVRKNIRAGQEVTTAVYAELENIEEKARQTPPRTCSFTRHNTTPDVQKLESSATIALPMRTVTAIVAIPQSEDTLTILCRKLTAIAELVSAGQSVAVVTGYAAAASQEQRAVQKATHQMRPCEGGMEWTTNIGPTPLSPTPLKTTHRCAEALNRLYKTDQAQPHHSVWFTKHRPVHLPLVNAMARVIGAEQDLVGGGVLTATQLADLQSINKILSVTAEIVKGHGSEPLLPAVNRAQAVVLQGYFAEPHCRP